MLRRYQYVRAIGDAAQAQRVLDDARRDGVALPDVLARPTKS